MSRTPLIEWVDHPTMNPRNTNQLRPLIERRTCKYLWGKRHFVVPRLVDKIFGNGRTLLALYPINFRPYHFVVRIDSGWSISNWVDGPKTPSEWIDEVYDATEEEYVEWPWAKTFGLRWSDDEQADCNSRISWDGGSCWDEMGWPRWARRMRGAA